MALLNALKTGTYSTVRVFAYSKQGGKELRFAVDIWEDSTKSKLLATIEKNIANPSVDRTLDNAGVNDAPANPSYGDRVLVGNSPTGDFSEFSPGSDVEWVEDGGSDINENPIDAWVRVGELIEDEIVYVTSEDKYYIYRDGLLRELKSHVGPAEWSQWFDPNQWNQSGKNLLNGIYEYLKTIPEFENCIDA